MNKRRTQFLSMGIPSMFVIFSVLCLVILALLTLGTSRQDLQAAQVSLKQTTDYCNACTQAVQVRERIRIDRIISIRNKVDFEWLYNLRISSSLSCHSEVTGGPG